jgi:hypothetical protein
MMKMNAGRDIFIDAAVIDRMGKTSHKKARSAGQ